MSLKCSKGFIERVAYKRKAYVKKSGVHVSSAEVPAVCIKKVGKPGPKGKKLIKFTHKKFLRNLGYSYKNPVNERHVAILQAVHNLQYQEGLSPHDAYLDIFRKLNAVATLRSNQPEHRDIYNVFKSDANWILDQYNKYKEIYPRVPRHKTPKREIESESKISRKRVVPVSGGKVYTRPRAVKKLCSRQSSKKYTSRASPPFKANEICNRDTIKKGNDGNFWISTADKRGIYTWKKY